MLAEHLDKCSATTGYDHSVTGARLQTRKIDCDMHASVTVAAMFYKVNDTVFVTNSAGFASTRGFYHVRRGTSFGAGTFSCNIAGEAR